jgi:SprT-like family
MRVAKQERPAATSSELRQRWLERAAEGLRLRFADAGYAVPQKVRVSIGWPKRAATCGAVGECWATEASSDQHAELFISPQLTEGARIIDVLAHELVHATVGTEAGHGKLFKRCALAVGLQGPMRTTTAGPDFAAWADALLRKIGRYPAGFLTDSPRQSTRLRRCQCGTCGYLVRVSRRWLDQAGPPICPTDRIAMATVETAKPTAAAA